MGIKALLRWDPVVKRWVLWDAKYAEYHYIKGGFKALPHWLQALAPSKDIKVPLYCEHCIKTLPWGDGYAEGGE